MSSLLDELAVVIDGHDCAWTLRVHTPTHGQASCYACEACADEVRSIFLKHLPTATDLVVTPMRRPGVLNP